MAITMEREWADAAMADDVDRLERLWTRSPALVNAPHPDHQRTALHLAAAWNAARAVRFLLTRALADVSCVDPDGCSPLHLAAASGAASAMQLLLAHDELSPALLDARTRLGHTPLHLAVASGAATCCRLLLATRAVDVSAAVRVDGIAMTPLDLALRYGHHSVAAALRDFICDQDEEHAT
ncbi:hypothetical protein P43SY_000842 [Pythium insidiosum]|uniref:Uncharacterized protein n=1 Tax=Pythium insidiosum TaxID=114742 RepID=A0AAD5LCW4_PYTIN|nr:hypothetical protein P43SY_000842 [Pythium insidiosum]